MVFAHNTATALPLNVSTDRIEKISIIDTPEKRQRTAEKQAKEKSQFNTCYSYLSQFLIINYIKILCHR